MRVVFNLTNAAILAAQELLDGDQIIDPPALAIFPAFNPLIQGTCTFDPAPGDLMENFIDYRIDNPLIPTTVQLKNHIEIVPQFNVMLANGVQSQIITFNIKDASNVLQNVSAVLNISCGGAFFASAQCIITAGTGTVKLTAGVQPMGTQIQAVDSVEDPVTFIGGLIPAIPVGIQIIQAANLQSQFANLVPDLPIVRESRVLFADGTHFVQGGLRVNEQGSPTDDYNAGGIHTLYASVAAPSQFLGVDDFDFTALDGENFRRFYARIRTQNPNIDTSYWIGLFNGDMKPGWPSAPTLSAGFRFFPQLPDPAIIAYVHDGLLAQSVNTGIAMTSQTEFDFMFDYDPTTNLFTFYIGPGNAVMTQVAQFTVRAGFTIHSFLGVTVLGRTENVNSQQISLSAIQLRYN